MTASLRALGVLVALFVTGAPLAVFLERRRTQSTRWVFEAIALGLVAQLAIGIIALRTGLYGTAGLATLTLVFVAAGTVAAIVWSRGWRPTLDAPWLAAMFGIVVVALLLRQHPSYFIFETGDMGEYVNRANAVARGANLVGSFPHGFTVYLASTNVLLGQAHTVAGLPALGVVLVLGIMATLRAVGFRPVAVLAVALLAALHPVTVWFSEFPVSEALYATLLTCALYFLVRARVDRSSSYAVASGVAFGSLLIVRGNAMLLAPVFVVVLLISAVVDDDACYRLQRIFTVVALAALVVAYGYDIHFPRDYIVKKQLHNLLPKFAFDAAQRMQLLKISLPLLAVVALLLLALLIGASRVRRWLRPRVEPRRELSMRAVAITTLAIGILLVVVIGPAGLVEGLGRWGAAVLLLGGLGLILLVWQPGRYVDDVIGITILLSIVTYALLFASRLPEPRPHVYLFYTDRYLFSEVLPLVFVVAGIAVHAAVGAVVHRDRRVRATAIAVATACFALALVPVVGETWKITRQTLYGDAYGAFQQLDALTRVDGTKPIVYSGVQRVPKGFIFGNTWRAFATPIHETFQRRVVAAPKKTRTPDPQLDPTQARAALDAAGFDGGYLVVFRAPDASRYPDDEHTRYVGTVDYEMPIINRHFDRAHEQYFFLDIQLDVYEIR